MHPLVFRYIFIKDSGVTGNLEVSIRKNKIDSPSPTPVDNEYKLKVHSKRNNDGYPHDDWEKFHDKLEKGFKTADNPPVQQV